MSRYFFHVENGAGAQRDDTGSDFTSPAQAIGEAAKTAGEMLRDDVRDHAADYRMALQVEDEAGNRVASITVSLSLAPQT